TPAVARSAGCFDEGFMSDGVGSHAATLIAAPCQPYSFGLPSCFDNDRRMDVLKTAKRRAWTARRSSPTSRLASGAQIDLAFGDRSQLLVGRLLFLERLGEYGCAIVAAELLGPGNQAAVARDLVMLGGLCRVDQRRIEHRLVGDFARCLVGLLDDAVDRGAIDRLYLRTVHLEHFLQALDVLLGLFEVRQE